MRAARPDINTHTVFGKSGSLSEHLKAIPPAKRNAAVLKIAFIIARTSWQAGPHPRTHQFHFSRRYINVTKGLPSNPNAQIRGSRANIVPIVVLKAAI